MTGSNAQIDALHRHFSRSNVRNALVQVIRWNFEEVRDWDLLDEDDINGGESEAYLREVDRAGLDNFTYRRLHDSIIAEAMRECTGPFVIAESDLRSLIESTLVVDPFRAGVDIDSTYGRFLGALASASGALLDRSITFSIGHGIPWVLSNKDPFIWKSATGYELRIPAEPPADTGKSPHPWGHPEGQPTFASLSASATESAFEFGARQTRQIVCSVVQMLRLAGTIRYRKAGLVHLPTEPHELALLRGSLDCYYAPIVQKDTIDRRLANALQLWCLADGQSRPGLRLSLAIASLEALLGQKAEGVSRLLGERIAVLLCRDIRQRLRVAEYVRKTLYDHRSSVLHGRSLEDALSSHHVENALRLAALAYRAVWETYHFRRSYEDPLESAEDLFKMLESKKWSGERVDGVPEDIENAAAECLDQHSVGS